MIKTQIELPEALFGRLRNIAKARDISVAELIRRGMEIYAMSCAEAAPTPTPWAMPVLRGSGGHLIDPAVVKVEASAIENRSGSAGSS